MTEESMMSSQMTRSEMIETLKGLIFGSSMERTTVKEREALDMAINELGNAEQIGQKGKKIESREEATVANEPWMFNGVTNVLLYEIAVSLGRIADLLADMNGYDVNFCCIEKRKDNG